MLFLKRHKNISNILNSRFEIEEKEALTQITLHKKQTTQNTMVQLLGVQNST